MPLSFTYVLMFIVMIIWGVNVVILKLLVEAFPAATMTSFRIMIAGITVFIIVFMFRSFKKMTRMEWGYTLIGTVLGVVGHHYFLAQGLTMTSASNTVLILALVPLTTSLCAVILLGDRLTKWRILGIVLAFIGVLFIQGGGGTWSFGIGELNIFISMFSQSVSFIYIKKATQSLDSKQITGIMLLLGSLLLLSISIIIEPNGLTQLTNGTPFLYIIFLFSAIVATGLGHFLFNAAIKKIGAGQTAVFSNFVPFFGLLSSAIFLGEALHWYQFFGFLFIVAGVLFGTGYVDKVWLKSPDLARKNIQEKNM